MSYLDQIRQSKIVGPMVEVENWEVYKELRPIRKEIATIEATAEKAQAQSAQIKAEQEAERARLETQSVRVNALASTQMQIEIGAEALKTAGYEESVITAWKQAQSLDLFKKLGYKLPEQKHTPGTTEK